MVFPTIFPEIPYGLITKQYCFLKNISSLQKSHETILPVLQCILFYLNLMRCRNIQNNFRPAVPAEFFYKSGSMLRIGIWGKWDFIRGSRISTWRQPFFRVIWKLCLERVSYLIRLERHVCFIHKKRWSLYSFPRLPKPFASIRWPPLNTEGSVFYSFLNADPSIINKPWPPSIRLPHFL